MVPFEHDLVGTVGNRTCAKTVLQKYSYVAALWGAFLLVYRWYHSKTGTVGVQVKNYKNYANYTNSLYISFLLRTPRVFNF